MRKIALAVSLLLACGHAAAATDISVDCDIDSSYDFHLSEKSVILLDRGASPHTVLVRQGRLFVDDRWVQVSAADARRLLDYEREARAAMPLAADVARQAAGIAFEVLGEVAAGFGSDPDQARRKFDGVRRELDAALAASVTPRRFNREQLNDAIGSAVAEAVPALVGDIVGGALRAAFSGDASRLQRLEGLDAEIEALVEPRARALEGDAQALCRHMEALDAIDDALEYRLPDGRALNLHQVDAGTRSGTE